MRFSSPIKEMMNSHAKNEGCVPCCSLHSDGLHFNAIHEASVVLSTYLLTAYCKMLCLGCSVEERS